MRPLRVPFVHFLYTNNNINCSGGKQCPVTLLPPCFCPFTFSTLSKNDQVDKFTVNKLNETLSGGKVDTLKIRSNLVVSPTAQLLTEKETQYLHPRGWPTDSTCSKAQFYLPVRITASEPVTLGCIFYMAGRRAGALYSVNQRTKTQFPICSVPHPVFSRPVPASL